MLCDVLMLGGMMCFIDVLLLMVSLFLGGGVNW